MSKSCGRLIRLCICRLSKSCGRLIRLHKWRLSKGCGRLIRLRICQLSKSCGRPMRLRICLMPNSCGRLHRFEQLRQQTEAFLVLCIEFNKLTLANFWDLGSKRLSFIVLSLFLEIRRWHGSWLTKNMGTDALFIVLQGELFFCNFNRFSALLLSKLPDTRDCFRRCTLHETRGLYFLERLSIWVESLGSF